MDYLKQKIKWILSVLGILGVAFAYEMSPTVPPIEQPIIPPEIITNPASIPTRTEQIIVPETQQPVIGGGTQTKATTANFVDNGKTLTFSRSNNDPYFEIRDEGKPIGGWDWAEYLFSIENKQATSTGQITIYGVDVLNFSVKNYDVEKQQTVQDYGQKTYTCATDWKQEPENEFGIINYSCGQEIRGCDLVNKTECTVNNDLLGIHQKTYYEDEWQGLPLLTSSRITEKVPSEFKAKNATSYTIPGGQKKLFKIRFAVHPKTQGELIVEWFNGVNSSVLR